MKKNDGRFGRLLFDKRAAWITSLFYTGLFLLVHVAMPWALSLLAIRYGWVDGRPSPWNLSALILVVPGIACTVWLITLHFRASHQTFLELKQGQKLITPGPYAFSRNPMYVCELTFWLGWALFYGSFTVLIGFLAWFVMFNFVIVPHEERDLDARFGDAYRQYTKMVPRWLGKKSRRLG